MDMGLNAIYGKESRVKSVKFNKANSEFKIFRCKSEFNGVMYGPKTLKFIGREIVHEKNHNIHCEYSFGSDLKNLY